MQWDKQRYLMTKRRCEWLCCLTITGVWKTLLVTFQPELLDRVACDKHNKEPSWRPEILVLFTMKAKSRECKTHQCINAYRLPFRWQTKKQNLDQSCVATQANTTASPLSSTKGVQMKCCDWESKPDATEVLLHVLHFSPFLKELIPDEPRVQSLSYPSHSSISYCTTQITPGPAKSCQQCSWMHVYTPTACIWALTSDITIVTGNRIQDFQIVTPARYHSAKGSDLRPLGYHLHNRTQILPCNSAMQGTQCIFTQ